MSNKVTRARLEGIDLARFLALVGMVIVNFDVVMVSLGGGISHPVATLFQGRAAATFVVLAGIGLGLGTARLSWSAASKLTLKRAAFLLVVGLLNAAIFEADIIHYYAVYFALAIVFLRAPGWLLWLAIFVLIFGFVVAVSVFNYETGWDWTTYSYTDFWSPGGALRNLFFNGWHPVMPWLAFLLFGLWLSRQALARQSVQIALTVGGLAALIAVTALSRIAASALVTTDPDAALLFATEPIPPGPFYMLAGISAACFTLWSCLLLAPMLAKAGIFAPLATTGRQTLTLYIAHIIIGMGLIEAFGLMGNQPGWVGLLASAVFCSAAIMFCWLWARRFKRGPIEALMRALTG
ncbi:MAG: heparan-alpha-glucosaminide N-acetyltransferase domain-containing protein [Henriciella sp.]|nr:heparan-alpha-glucosaminide N-acetyltransferase domain-containing protein [Henriciella sp.]